MRSFAPIPVLALLALAGCNSSPLAPTNDAAQERQQTESIRQDIAQIPLPTKTRYLAVHSLTLWENPYLTIQGSMLTLHVTMADGNTTDIGVGGILRPVGARRQDLNIRTADLPTALNSIPQTSWPYGRVVALEEAHDAPASARPELRRNMEAAIKTLGDLGIVVYEWQENSQTVR